MPFREELAAQKPHGLKEPHSDFAHSTQSKMPNKKTRKVLDNADKNIGLIKYKSVDDMFKALGI